MKIPFFKTLPQKLNVAVSGGVDSMVLLHSLLRTKRDISVLHFQHENDGSSIACSQFIKEYCFRNNIPLVFSDEQSECKNSSQEMRWRKSRHQFFQNYENVVTGHTLDDAVEWYIYQTMRMSNAYMEYSGNTLKPFICCPKKQIIEYAKYYSVPFIEDETNFDDTFCTRNHIRKNVLPEILKFSPGLYSMVRDQIRKKDKEN